MTRRCPIRVRLTVALIAAATSAHAGPNDHAAIQEADRAMNELFVGAKFDEAKTALIQTITTTCVTGCDKRTLARVHRDLGVVYVTGFRDAKKGRAEFEKAKGLDKAIQLDPVLTTPEVQAAFDSAQASGAGSVEESVVLEEEDSEDKPKKKKKKHHHVEEQEAPPSCSGDADCDAGRACRDGTCIERPRPPQPPSAWLSFGLVQDFAFGSGSDVCNERSQVSGGFTCLRSAGSQYHGTPLPGQGGSVSGISLSSTRVTLSSYIPLGGSLSGGLRLGYAFLGQGPQPDGGKQYNPLLLEVQGAYWLSGKAFATKWVGTFVEATGGIAEVDGKSSTSVVEDPSKPRPANQFDNPDHQTLTVYKKSGASFISAGGGLFLPFGRAAGLLADLRLSVLFPTSGVALSLGVQGAFGL